MTSSFDCVWETVILICFYYGIGGTGQKTGVDVLGCDDRVVASTAARQQPALKTARVEYRVTHQE
jgi:hypothetical protein